MTTSSPSASLSIGHDKDYAAGSRPRLESVDLLRGLVMVIMVLDHTRDFFMPTPFDVTDLSKTNPALFFTRWITHFCAPVFVFLAGTGAFLSGDRDRDRPKLARFLATRGLWLIVLELTVGRLGLLFNLDYAFVPLIVLWAIGVSMIVLSILVFLPTWAVGLFGVAMIALHNAFDGMTADALGPFRPLLLLHRPGPVFAWRGMQVFSLYPLIPWIGVMAAGYAFGAILVRDPEKRRTRLLLLGSSLTLAFVALRAVNRYGDPSRWEVLPDPLTSVMSFLNCTKYPPSLLFLLMTLGPAIALLAFLDRLPGPIGRILLTIGRVPLFYYLLQWYVIHGLAVILESLRGRPIAFLFASQPFSFPADYGYSLPLVYVLWAAIVGIMYPVCRWFGDLKRRCRDGWLRYF